MTREEKITKLCEKALVSEEEAAAALNACNDDILDAVLYLETLGKVRNPKVAAYVEEPVEDMVKKESKKNKDMHKSESFGEAVGRFCNWCLRVIKAGCSNYFDVLHNGEKVFGVPIILPVILLIPCGWLEAILLLVGLFFGFSYRFSGPAFSKKSKVNDFSDRCSTKTEEFKEGFNRTFHGDDIDIE